MEIERKFLVKSLPTRLKPDSGVRIRQCYFSRRLKDVEIRLREKGAQHYITIKAGQGRARLEEEIRISMKTFAALWPLVRAECVVKRRYKLKHGRKVIELDIYEGRHRGLVTAEVEFNSKRESETYTPPEWLGREVTGKRRYANQWLGRQNGVKRKWHLSSNEKNRSARA